MRSIPAYCIGAYVKAIIAALFGLIVVPPFIFLRRQDTMTQPTNGTRRHFIRIAAAGVALAPFATALLSPSAAAADMVSEADPTAKALNYVADATKSAKRTDKAATCANCQLFTGKAGAADGPCAVFPGKSVSAKGWCSSWVKKA
jgi:hypothetical protein